MISTEDFTQVQVAERQRDLARIAASSRFSRLARRVRRQRNPQDVRLPEPANG
ncbi:MAG TPA: hypothetical protein VGJ86_00135 [Acidimicrobiales bacterium]|jgi:hypothetical protein